MIQGSLRKAILCKRRSNIWFICEWHSETADQTSESITNAGLKDQAVRPAPPINRDTAHEACVSVNEAGLNGKLYCRTTASPYQLSAPIDVASYGQIFKYSVADTLEA